MKLSKPKTLNEKIKDFKIEEVTPETVEKEKEETEDLISKVMKPAEKVADEVTKETAAPDVRGKKQKRLVKDRKELACLIKEAKVKNHVFSVTRSLKEGYRYIFTEDWDDDGDWGVNPNLGEYGKVTVQEYRDFLEDAINVLDNYDPEEFISFKPNTYKLNNPFIGTTGGFIDMNYPVYKESNENESLSEAKEEETVPVEDTAPVVEPEIEVNAVESMINGLLQDKFSEIETLKGVISTLQFQNTNEDIVVIINSLLDDANIHIGMLQKAVELVKPESGEAIEAGKEKAAGMVEAEPKPEPEKEEE